MRGTHTCRCGQRFKLPRAGRYDVIPDEDAQTLFYLPSSKRLIPFEQVSSTVTELDVAGEDLVQLPVSWIDR
jgi:hypothetical protein